jgi:hypothetical protein
MKALKDAVLVLFGFFLFSLGCKAADSGSFDVGFDYTYVGVHVNNMPLAIRDVPVHPSDVWASGGQGPVEQTDYNSNHRVDLALMWAKEFGLDDKSPPCFNIGLGMDWIIFPWVNAQKAERNYMNDPGSGTRGEGSALTYVGLRQAGVIPSFGNTLTDVLLNWTPTAKFEVCPFNQSLKDLWFGISVSYYTVDAQTGWDRNDSLDPRKDYVLMKVIPIRIYSTYFFDEDVKGGTRSGFTFGIQLQPGAKTDLGQQADMSVAQPALFAGYSLRMW